VTALQRKAVRDLFHLRGQALAIAFVIAGGIATLVMAQSTYQSLEGTRARFYGDYALADVWASAKRAPNPLAGRIAEIPGVQTVETRLIASATLSVAGFDEPVRAQVLSLPKFGGQPLLNKIYLRSGRLPDPEAPRETLVSEAFAEAHGLRPGDHLEATIYGHRQRLDIVGVAISPEFVYQIQPGATFPDFLRFGILWMNTRALEAALDMTDAFNSTTLRLRPGADTAAVLDALDAILARYGGLGAYARKDQLSNRFLSEELRQLATMARLFPTIFLGVAAFLLNVVLARLIGMQRDQIAILKAFGYSGASIALHYVQIALSIAGAGALIGVAGGAWLGHLLAGVYRDFYRFPFLDYRLSALALSTGVAVAFASAALGALQSATRSARLPPAEAMRPPAPERYRPALFERLGFGRMLGQPARMVLRYLERRPWKALLSVVGLALAGAIMMVGRFQGDALELMIDTQLRVAQHQDLSVDFIEPTSRQAADELRALPVVRRVEPVRSVSVRMRFANYSYRTGITGLAANATLRRPVDADGKPIVAPEHGILLTDYLSKLLHIGVGDRLQVDVLEGRQAHIEVPVAGFVNEYIGAQGYMDLDALNRLLGDGDVISGALLALDPGDRAPLYYDLDRRPRVAGVNSREAQIGSFYKTMGESLLFFTFIAGLLGAVINFGVVYNSARIALSERGRELASLRVLGFTKGEVSRILLGELGLLVSVSIPLGFAAGWGLCWVMAIGFESDLFRVPVTLLRATYAFAAVTMAVSTVLSALIVRRRIDRLDLIGVLKTRE
jgi:putative ABC transport system permease protein